MHPITQPQLIAVHLSVGQLGTAQQFMLWALRQRTLDAEPGSPPLAAGFRLAIGLAGMERAMAAFEELLTLLARSPSGAPLAAPLTCACVAAGEAAMLGLIADGGRYRPAENAGPRAPADTALLRAAAKLAFELERAGLDKGELQRGVLH